MDSGSILGAHWGYCYSITRLKDKQYKGTYTLHRFVVWFDDN